MTARARLVPPVGSTRCVESSRRDYGFDNPLTGPILRHVANQSAQGRVRDLIDRLPADQNRARLDVRKPQQQTRDRRLAAS